MEKMKKNENGKKNDSRVKTRKGSLEQKEMRKFLKPHGRNKWKNGKATTGQHLNLLRGLLPPLKPKI